MDNQRRLSILSERLAPLRARIDAHPVHAAIRSLADVGVFMQSHVFAVWDFMCLLKGLQRTLTCVDLPWRPVGSPVTRRLINEIVTEEESDLIDGIATGHFELYLRAMEEIGADTVKIRRFLAMLAANVPVRDALALCGAPRGAQDFVCATFDVLDTVEPHRIGAAFTFGREALIPMMFRNIAHATDSHTSQTGALSLYLRRHLELDEIDHGPKALAMLSELCGDDDEKWEQAARTAEEALEARIGLWSAISADIRTASAPGRLHPAAETELLHAMLAVGTVAATSRPIEAG